MKGPGYRDSATCQENHARFVERVAASQQVWGLKGPNGWANAESNEPENADVLLFWSDERYATRAQADYPDHTPTPITLFDFLFRWLPGMSGDGVLAGKIGPVILLDLTRTHLNCGRKSRQCSRRRSFRGTRPCTKRRPKERHEAPTTPRTVLLTLAGSQTVKVNVRQSNRRNTHVRCSEVHPDYRQENADTY
jgi:hypothetical protein